MTSLCPSNGAVNRFTRTHGREWEPWIDSRGSRDLKVVNGVKDHSRKHTCDRTGSRERVYGYSQPFTAFHGLCVPVNRFTCEGVNTRWKMNRVIFHLSHVCFREPIHRSSFTVCFRERVHLSRKHTVKDELIHLIHHSFYRQHGIFHSRESVHRLFPWNISWWRVLWRHYALAMEPWTGSREHTAVNGSRESIHAVHEIWKSWMAWKIIHVNTPVNGFTWKSLRLFTAFHGLSRPVCSCESIHLWIGSPCVYALNRFTVCLRPKKYHAVDKMNYESDELVHLSPCVYMKDEPVHGNTLWTINVRWIGSRKHTCVVWTMNDQLSRWLGSSFTVCLRPKPLAGSWAEGSTPKAQSPRSFVSP